MRFRPFAFVGSAFCLYGLAVNWVDCRISSLWDGLTSSTDRILVLGATNRPNDIDSAILRRMPKRFSVGLPDVEQRQKILTLVRPPSRVCALSGQRG